MNTIRGVTTVYSDVTAQQFEEEIRPRNRPAILKGLVRDWPSVQAGLQSPGILAAYLKQMDVGVPVDSLAARAESGGRFFYSDDLRGFNFQKTRGTLSAFLDRLVASSLDTQAPALYVQSAPVQIHLPRFHAEHRNPVLEPAITPRIWIGNSVTATTHSDMASNLACVVAGCRRFTLFPPEQLKNLYIGPLEYSPAGRPVSMVDLQNPDFERFPRFVDALAAAEVAELEAGDAIYVPYYWWHHVRSLSSFNVLINYWWNDGPADSVSPYESMMIALLTIRDLPEAQRAIWRDVFDHYIFMQDGDPAAHLPPDRRGVLGPITPQHRAHIKTVVAKLLSSS